MNGPTLKQDSTVFGKEGNDASKKTAMPEKKQKIISAVVTFILAFLFFYFKLPALNYKDSDLYVLLAIIFAVYLVTRVIVSGWFTPTTTFKALILWFWQKCRCASILFVITVGIFLLGTVISCELFRAREYSNLMTVSEGDFTEDVYSISYGEIPMLDATSASELGKRALGTLSDMVSQFEVSGAYTQINYDGQPIRIASLNYGNIFKWLENTSDGLPGYVFVNMLTQEAEVVRTDDGLRYSNTERLFRNLKRYLRLKYPTYMFAEQHLEIDNDGIPYWICPRIEKTIWPFGGNDVIGIVIVNAATGECSYFDVGSIPSWIDQVYSPSLILQQYEYYGKYGGGFFNSLLGQKDVTVTTAGYNFIALNDDVYLYTGITSAGNDEANVGFILCNLRTKETRFYQISGATEYSAQRSAEGIVQDMAYTATFPLLLNVSDQPTYFMSLKDSASLVKCYAMVNVQRYQIVATGATVEECERNYIALLRSDGVQAIEESTADEGLENLEKRTVSGIVGDIRMSVINGSSLYYIQLEGGSEYYTISSADCAVAAIVDPGDYVAITYTEASESGLIHAMALEMLE